MDQKTKIMSDLEGLTFDDWHMYHSDTEVQGIAIDALELLKNEPEIVRCKDCRNWIPGWVDDYDTFIPPRCKRNTGVWASNDYCSYVDKKVKQDG